MCRQKNIDSLEKKKKEKRKNQQVEKMKNGKKKVTISDLSSQGNNDNCEESIDTIS